MPSLKAECRRLGGWFLFGRLVLAATFFSIVPGTIGVSMQPEVIELRRSELVIVDPPIPPDGITFLSQPSDGRNIDAYANLTTYVEELTGVPATVPYHDVAIPLQQTPLEEMLAWRSPESGTPWSVWARERDPSLDSIYHYALRHNLARLLSELEISSAIEEWLVRQRGVSDWVPEHLGRNWDGWENRWDHFKWFRENVSEFAGTGSRQALGESFAWYTSRDYVPGSLPEFFETLFERMIAGTAPGMANHSQAHIDEVLKPRLANLRKVLAGEIPDIPQEQQFAGQDVQAFIHKRDVDWDVDVPVH